MKITLSNKILDIIDVTKLLEISAESVERKLISNESGRDHYRLLAYLGYQFNNISICDLGTCKGSSALALSLNPNNKVISFDINERITPIIETIKYLPQPFTLFRPPNLDFIVTNRILNYSDILLKSSLIFVDISHNGKDEREIYNFLLKNNWQGLLLLDDIDYYNQAAPPGNEAMKDLDEFWKELKVKNNVYDLTKYGHHTGSGLVDFSHKLEIVLE